MGKLIKLNVYNYYRKYIRKNEVNLYNVKFKILLDNRYT